MGFTRIVGEPCPAIASGPGRVVLGTFHHSAGDVYDVRLSDGSQLGVTARHPVWSVDRGEWVSVGDLEPGETLETLDGPVQFESATPRAEAAAVFNLEVDADHAYRVGEHGVLVHNASADNEEQDFSCLYKDCAEAFSHTQVPGCPFNSEVGDRDAACKACNPDCPDCKGFDRRSTSRDYFAPKPEAEHWNCAPQGKRSLWTNEKSVVCGMCCTEKNSKGTPGVFFVKRCTCQTKVSNDT